MPTTETIPLAHQDGVHVLRRNHLQAFWILIATFTLSFGYEAIYRYIVKAGISAFDAWSFSEIMFYLIGFGMTFLVLAERFWVWWIELLFLLVLIAIAIFYYDPIMLLARHPGLIDWMEDTVYTGLLFVVAFLCLGNLRFWFPQRGSNRNGGKRLE
jgi:hypothetical protein